jgi:hypothetical protein
MTWADCFERASEYDVTVAEIRETLADVRADD